MVRMDCRDADKSVKEEFENNGSPCKLQETDRQIESNRDIKRFLNGRDNYLKSNFFRVIQGLNSL